MQEGLKFIGHRQGLKSAGLQLWSHKCTICTYGGCICEYPFPSGYPIDLSLFITNTIFPVLLCNYSCHDRWLYNFLKTLFYFFSPFVYLCQYYAVLYTVTIQSGLTSGIVLGRCPGYSWPFALTDTIVNLHIKTFRIFTGIAYPYEGNHQLGGDYIFVSVSFLSMNMVYIHIPIYMGVCLLLIMFCGFQSRCLTYLSCEFLLDI